MKKICLSKDTQSKLNEIVSTAAKIKWSSFIKRTKNGPYDFCELVNLKICPYCNINYIYTIKNTVRADIDHVVSKTIGPEIPKFYDGLVPACPICNSRLKGIKKIAINPYHCDFDSIKQFYVIFAPKKNIDYFDEKNLEIALKNKPKVSNFCIRCAEQNIKIFKIKERYQLHKNEVVSILKKMNYYNRYRMSEIANLFCPENELVTNSNFSLYLYSILFSDILFCEINQTSLGKLKKRYFQ